MEEKEWEEEKEEEWEWEELRLEERCSCWKEWIERVSQHRRRN